MSVNVVTGGRFWLGSVWSMGWRLVGVVRIFTIWKGKKSGPQLQFQFAKSTNAFAKTAHPKNSATTTTPQTAPPVTQKMAIIYITNYTLKLFTLTTALKVKLGQEGPLAG